MNYAENMQGIPDNRAFRKQMLDQHRAGFDLWNELAQLTEEALVKERDVSQRTKR
jgi:hypothetical protein